jgi:hypothetical protein
VKSDERLNYWRCKYCEKEIFGSARLARLGHLAGEKGKGLQAPCKFADIPESVVKIAKDEFDKQLADKKGGSTGWVEGILQPVSVFPSFFPHCFPNERSH